MLKTLRRSPRTTALGGLTIVGLLARNVWFLFDGDPTTTFAIAEIMAALPGLGLLFARDE